MGTDLPQPPYDQEKMTIAFGANIEPDVDAARRQRIMIFVILLIVPAINLSSMTQSRLRQRVAEIGVRRAFGSTRMELMGQIIAENLVITLLVRYCRPAAERGFCVRGQYVAFCAGVQPDFESAGSGRFNPAACFHLCLGAALLFVLNLMSSGFPAWRASRIGIVNALGGRLH